jgi:cell division protein FtsB
MYATHVATSVRRARPSWQITVWTLRIIAALSVAAFVGYVPYRLYVRIGLQQHVQLRRELGTLMESNDQLRRENNELRLQLLRVQEDDTEIERVARDELGLIHSDELLFKVE